MQENLLTSRFSAACNILRSNPAATPFCLWANRYLCDYVADRFAQEPSHSKGGMWAALLTDMLVTTRERAYGSISDQALDRLCALASRLDLAVREDAFSDVAVREVQR